MAFQPNIKEELAIGGVPYHIAEHPFAPGIPYGQEGRTAVVYQLVGDGEGEGRAFKVFKPRFRVPALVSLSRRLAPFAQLPGLRVCSRTVLTPQRDRYVLADHPDLLYAVVMPWIEGPSWMEVLLNNQALSQEQSLTIARALAGVLAGMEQEGLAHCDLSGPNLLLPVLDERQKTKDEGLRPDGDDSQLEIELVDVEQMYGPDLRKPDFLPTGSSGYAHNTAPEGMWSPDADRYAGALLLAEILGWCDERTRNKAWGESYFDPKEMQQQKSERYGVLTSVLGERWGEGIARLFEQAWRSGNSVECPTFGEWMMKLPLTVADALVQAATSATGAGQPSAIAERAASVPATTANEVAQPANTAKALVVENATSPQPVAQTGPAVASPHLERFFDEGLAAYGRGEWTAAKELFGAVVAQNRGYAKGGLYAAELLADAAKRLARPPIPPPRPIANLRTSPGPSPGPGITQPSQYQGVARPPVTKPSAPAYYAPVQTPVQPPPAYYAPIQPPPAVVAPKKVGASILVPAIVVLALLVAGGVTLLFMSQANSQAQAIAAQATTTAQAGVTATAQIALQQTAEAKETASALEAAHANATSTVVAEATTNAHATETSAASAAETETTIVSAAETETATAPIGDVEAAAKIEKVLVDYDVTEAGLTGMRVHVKFMADNLKGVSCGIAAYFYKNTGEVLKDTDGKLNTPDGQVAVSEPFKPNFDNSIYDDFEIFMPYNQIDVDATSGTFNLRVQVQAYIITPYKLLAESDYIDFVFTK